ncbi:polygalacturonase [Dyadobacter sp. BE34]|uniref:Polygalacturonase n=1 Tax=Dyadobacter fermentans TaxID=94254 RepID=A0ABU1QV53_9BACT|nr:MULTISPECIES: glycosyl hydrolase family 28-related protein [Dyadobacter]MDR6804635.1 polygalacturonase [Dyadobacter fermentans]MDR7043606.1 polygalacturonase [Dyadobacter sp. BE242]MDR7197918.1 polygalacturonase [Dyadobacter sp. BE34]MDR7214649.1 polygalacturonase [Dyadobacter sp. BE31]MDR7262184.1 polygalacturonase [Dyadobacter sp. BE32]
MKFQYLLTILLVCATAFCAIGQQDDTKALQKAIDRAAQKGTNRLDIPAGRYILSAPLLLPSNFTLVADPGAYLELKKSSNQYLLRNKDIRKGNENIRVFGGKWNGNAWTQTRTIRDKVENSDFCFGFFFYKVKNLEVGKLQIDSTRSWGIAYMECDSVYIHDIRFQQNPFRDARFTSALNHNGDGVTGGGNNVLIENISGFTNDDLIAFASGGASFQGKMSPFPARNYENVTVRNIFPESIYDSIPALKGVAFYTFEHTRVSNITIDNVKGNTAAASVLFYSLFDKKGYFSNVKVSRIEGTNVYSRSEHPDLHASYAPVTFKNSEIDRLVIEGVRREEGRYAEPTFRFDDHMDVKELLLTNVSIVHKGLTGNLLIDFGKANIPKFRMSDVEVLNSK